MPNFLGPFKIVFMFFKEKIYPTSHLARIDMKSFYSLE